MAEKKQLRYKGKPARIIKSPKNSRMYLLQVSVNGKWVSENVSTSKRHLTAIAKGV